ncbi:TIGR04282 family arsenosugar biosynthesis glycosyltransferase [Haloprofundus halobius]|uniref:TIGR04282 family arsenosugar biosynthesis glycosyltransferase n=1 Tax=Haloprofundus halobius TaxID=2876194 RepID=UPI001CC98513|nr:DUF2064 domain-containing protein [Haloprofundus halobius]
MTVVAVLADPPRPGLVLPNLAETSPLTESEAADLYAAMLRDTFLAAVRSGGELLVNYRPDDLLPDEFVTDEPAAAAVRAVAADALGDLSDVRVEKQVGSTFDARAGNTVSHLLNTEGEQSVAVVRGNAPLLTRTLVDSAAMKLRSTPVVLGPSTDGRCYYAAFTDTIDFAEAFTASEIETLAARGHDAGLDVDFVPMQPTIETGEDLLTVLPMLHARREAGRIVPKHTAEFVAELGLRVVAEDGEKRVVRA